MCRWKCKCYKLYLAPCDPRPSAPPHPLPRANANTPGPAAALLAVRDTQALVLPAHIMHPALDAHHPLVALLLPLLAQLLVGGGSGTAEGPGLRAETCRAH